MSRIDPTIREALVQAAGSLSSETARLDAELLLAKILNKSRSHLYTWPEQRLSQDQYQCFLLAIDRRSAGEPIAYLTGSREFWSLELEVSSEVLIPRPETELLVEIALSLLPATNCEVADLGTGSGAIALALASERPNWNIIGTDISTAALNIARNNAQALNLDALKFVISDWYKDIPQRNYQLIVSNPPYIKNQDLHLQRGDIRYEPQIALRSGVDGLRDLSQLIAGAAEYLCPNGWLMLEHGFDQAESVTQFFNQAGFTSTETYHDLARQPRVTIGRSNPKRKSKE